MQYTEKLCVEALDAFKQEVTRCISDALPLYDTAKTGASVREDITAVDAASGTVTVWLSGLGCVPDFEALICALRPALRGCSFKLGEWPYGREKTQSKFVKVSPGAERIEQMRRQAMGPGSAAAANSQDTRKRRGWCSACVALTLVTATLAVAVPAVAYVLTTVLWNAGIEGGGGGAATS